jgi:hypothetical protein
MMLYIGAIGVLIGILLLLYYLVRRINWFIRAFSGKKAARPKLLASLRNLVTLFLWIAVFGMIMFFGFFLRAYYAFTLEEPVAEVMVQPLGEDETSRVTLIQYVPADSQITRQFLIKGDQWVLEGDILKWDDWLNFMGFHTRYRLTRIRGRYLRTTDEMKEQPTIYSLVENENHPLWRYLYNYGPDLPMVSTVYGNAVFQTSGKEKRFKIFVGLSGFVVREISTE